MIFGSYARNEQTPCSDLDLWIVIDKPIPNIESLHINLSDGILCDIWIRHEDELSEIVNRVANGTGSTWDLIATTGRIYYDPQRILSDFQEELNDAISNGVSISFSRIMFQRFKLVHGIISLRNHVTTEDPVYANMMLGVEACSALEAFFLLRGWVFSGSRLALSELKERELDAYVLIVSVLSHEKSVEERIKALENFITQALEPVGGAIQSDNVFALTRSNSSYEESELFHKAEVFF